MSNIIEFRPRAALGVLDVAAAAVQKALLGEMQARGIQRPDIAEAFGAKLRELLVDWEKQVQLTFSCDSQLSDATMESIQAGVNQLGARATVAITDAFTRAAVNAVVASFDGD